MFAIIIGLIVIALVVTLLLKGYYPQAILFMGGVVLLTCTAIFGWGDLLNAKQSCSRVQLSSAGAICSMPNRRRTLSALIFSKSSALAFHPASPV